MTILRRPGGAAAVALALLVAPAASAASAKTVSLHATLRPMRGIAGHPRGRLTGHYDAAKQIFHWHVTYGDLASQAIAVQCRRPAGTPGPRAAIALRLTGTPPHPLPFAPLSGKVALTAAQAKQLLAGHWRVVVETVDHRDGALAGRLRSG